MKAGVYRRWIVLFAVIFVFFLFGTIQSNAATSGTCGSGERTRTCSVCGDTETEEIAKLAPSLKKVKIKKAKDKTVTWKKTKNKYVQIQYSADKSFTDAKMVTVSAKKNSKKIAGLKKGYYVRIRAYDKKGHISKWSKIVKVR